MRPMTLAGIVLMVVAFVILGVFVIAPAAIPIENSPLLKSILQATLCNPGDTLSAAYSTYNTPTSSTRTTTLTCHNSDDQTYSASGKGVLMGLVGFLVPFLAGMGLWSVDSNRKKRLRLAQIEGSVLRNPRAAYNVSNLIQSNDRPAANGTFTSELSELKSALDAGLITEKEYAAKHKEILGRL